MCVTDKLHETAQAAPVNEFVINAVISEMMSHANSETIARLHALPTI